MSREDFFEGVDEFCLYGSCKWMNTQKNAGVTMRKKPQVSSLHKNVLFMWCDRVNDTSTWYDRVISYRCTKIIKVINVQWNWYKISVYTPIYSRYITVIFNVKDSYSGIGTRYSNISPHIFYQHRYIRGIFKRCRYIPVIFNLKDSHIGIGNR